MDDCDDILQELEGYLDRELSPEEWRSIQGHLNGCLDCLHVFDFHAELRMVISKKCRQDPFPPGLLARIESCFGTVDDGAGDDQEPTSTSRDGRRPADVRPEDRRPT